VARAMRSRCLDEIDPAILDRSLELLMSVGELLHSVLGLWIKPRIAYQGLMTDLCQFKVAEVTAALWLTTFPSSSEADTDGR
jgi:hypothetical protein